MQVTHIQDHVSHAVIGANKARDFSISDSAEFFNILSSTLYSDKILAVVREVLCNAWDIHIQTGRIDKPVEVILDQDKLTIRDHGTGISDDNMVPVYCTYGNSTKKLDGKQTGGFGLGCKAPFAMVEHFEVTSWYGGKKTIYAISKSSAEVGGKPSLMPIVSIPCGDETGLAVSMAVAPRDIAEFRRRIHTIARFGEMNVVMNDIPIATVPFSQAKHGFLITRDIAGVSGDTTNNLFVRYGNVIYPIPEHEKYVVEYRSALKLIQKIGERHTYNALTWKIIFQAKPDTISVTPSRESLSMTDHTALSIKELLTDFQKISEVNLYQTCLEIEKEAIAEVWKKGRAVDLLTSNNSMLRVTNENGFSHSNVIKAPEIITDIPQLGRAYMAMTYPTFANFPKQDTLMRLDILEKNGFGGTSNRGKIQSFRRELLDPARKNERYSSWFQRRLVQPLVRKISAVPELSANKLLVYGDHQDRDADKNDRRRSWGLTRTFIEASRFSPRSLDNYIMFLRNIVVISFNRLDVEERLPSFPIMKEKYGRNHDLLVYIVSRTDKKIDIARDFFAKQGMVVVDLTKVQEWETPEVIQPAVKLKPVKPRKKGLPKLSAILFRKTDGSYKFDHTLVRTNEDIERIETPQFISKINPRAQAMGELIYRMSNDLAVRVAQQYGSLGGIVVNENQSARFTNELKVPDISTWLMDKVKSEVLTNPRIQLGFGFKTDRWKISVDHVQSRLIKSILNSQDLALEFGILNEMNQEDKLLLDVVDFFNEGWGYYVNDPKVKEMKAHMDSVPVEPAIFDLVDKVKASKLVGLLDVNQLAEIFSPNPTELQKKQKSGALDLLLYAMEG